VLVFRTELENKVRLQQRVIFYKKISSFSVSRTKLKNKVSLQPRVNILQKEIECQSNFYKLLFEMVMVNSLMNETSKFIIKTSFCCAFCLYSEINKSFILIFFQLNQIRPGLKMNSIHGVDLKVELKQLYLSKFCSLFPIQLFKILRLDVNHVEHLLKNKV